VRQKQLRKALLQLFLPVVIDDYKRSDASSYSTESWSRMGSLRQFRWFALSISLACTSNIFLTCKLWNWGGIAPLRSLATRLVATVFWLRATDQRRNSWLSEVHVHIKLTNTIFNNPDNSVYLGNLYTVSTDNPAIMFIFLIYSLALCLGNVSNSKVTWNLHKYVTFYHKMLGGTKDIMSPPVQKLGGTCPPKKLGPWS